MGTQKLINDPHGDLGLQIAVLVKITPHPPPSQSVSQFEDPAVPSHPSRHIGLVVLICSKLCLNAQKRIDSIARLCQGIYIMLGNLENARNV